MNNQFSENLKKIRKENNLSQEQLADELGVSRQAISKWESAIAYPEMDKIIALCDKFNLNIDDLLHKDIKEAKGEEESKKKLNGFVDDFLRFITNTISLFSNMNFKSKIKCLFEQGVIATILFIASMGIYFVLDHLFRNFINFLPNKPYYIIANIFDSIIIVSLLIVCIIIITHIFKTRYLDYYEKIKEDNDSVDNVEEKKTKEKNDKVLFKRNDNKIIIRDPKNSEYKFINTLFKLIIGVIKFFSLFFGVLGAFVLIGLLGAFIISFTLWKTGFFFIGLLVTILSSSVIAIVILLLILNFVFNRKNDKKKMIWSFILSLVTFGIGCGLIFIGTLSFDVIEKDSTFIKIVTREYKMKDDLLVYPYGNYDIEYKEADNTNIKIEYSISKYCEIEDSYNEDNDRSIMAWTHCENPTKIIREFINNANNKKIIPISNKIEKITVYTTKSNIDKLKNNWNNYFNGNND